MTLAITEFDTKMHDSFEAGEIGAAILRRWRFIAGAAALGLVLGLYVVMTATPKFTVNGAMYLGDPAATGGNGDQGNFLTAYQNTGTVNTLVSLLQSRALVEKAILQTGLNASITPVGAAKMPYWRWKYVYGRAIDAFAPRSGTLVAQDAVISDPGSSGFGAILKFGDNGHYIATTKPTMLRKAKTLFTGVLGEPVSQAGVSFVLKSADGAVLPAAGSRYMLSVAPAKAVADQVLGGAYTATAGAGASDPTQVADLQLLWQNPYQGAAFVNQLMRDFIDMQLSWNTQSASNTEAFVTSELAKVEAQMQHADKALADYQARTGILEVSGTAQALIDQLSQYKMQQTTLELKQQALTQVLDSLRNNNGSDPYLISQIDDPVLTNLASELATAQTQLSSQRVTLTGAAPEVETAAASVASLRQSVRALLLNDQKIATRNLQNINNVITTAEETQQKMPAESLEVNALTRASDVSGRLYVMLMQKEEEAEVSKAATIVDSRIVSPAEVPLAATTPKATITILGGLILGFLFGIGTVLARRAFSGRFQSYEEVRRFAPSEIFGMVPLVPQLERNASRLSHDRQTPFSESIRMLRSTIYQSCSAPGAKVINITSATVGDGKSTVAINLARMLAEDGKRTVLVDADLHQGRLHEFLGLPRSPGVSDYILGRTAMQYQVPGERFAIVPCGTATVNGSELVNMPSLDELFEKLKIKFDYIITDCPPLPVVADTLALARFADIVLSVVYIDRTSRHNFALHLSALRARNRPHGVIVNGVANAETVYGYAHTKRQTILTRARQIVASAL